MKGSRGQDAHASPSLPPGTPRDALAYSLTNLVPANTSLLLAFRLSFPARVAARKRHDCSSSYVRAHSPTVLFLPSSFTLSCLNLFRAYIPSMFIVRVRSIFVMRVVLRRYRIFTKRENFKILSTSCSNLAIAVTTVVLAKCILCSNIWSTILNVQENVRGVIKERQD